MSVSDGRLKLKKAGESLTASWLDVRQTWRDEVSFKFEEAYLTPLFIRLKNAEKAMDHMAMTIAQVQRDCCE